MSGFGTLHVETREQVTRITLNRPERRNALSLEMKAELSVAIRAACDDHDIRCVVLTGAGRAFCAGADLGDLAPESHEAYRRRLKALQRDLVLAIVSADKPFIAAVNGAAVGGGFALAVACDLIVASHDAWFSAPFVGRVGVAPDLGLGQMLPAAVGAHRARWLFLTGERLSADVAASWGLVSQVVQAHLLDSTVDALAIRLVRNAPPGRLGHEAADATWPRIRPRPVPRPGGRRADVPAPKPGPRRGGASIQGQARARLFRGLAMDQSLEYRNREDRRGGA